MPRDSFVHGSRPARQHAPGVTAYIDAGLHDPGTTLEAAAATLDFSRPVGLMLLGVMAHIGDDAEARSILDRLLNALPAGSHLVLSDGTNTDKAREEAHRRHNTGDAVPYVLRGPRADRRLLRRP